MAKLFLFDSQLKSVFARIPYPKSHKDGVVGVHNGEPAKGFLLGCNNKNIVDTVVSVTQSGTNGCRWVPGLTIEDMAEASTKMLLKKRKVCGMLRVIYDNPSHMTDYNQVNRLLEISNEEDFFLFTIGTGESYHEFYAKAPRAYLIETLKRAEHKYDNRRIKQDFQFIKISKRSNLRKGMGITCKNQYYFKFVCRKAKHVK